MKIEIEKAVSDLAVMPMLMLVINEALNLDTFDQLIEKLDENKDTLYLLDWGRGSSHVWVTGMDGIRYLLITDEYTDYPWNRSDWEDLDSSEQYDLLPQVVKKSLDYAISSVIGDDTEFTYSSEIQTVKTYLETKIEWTFDYGLDLVPCNFKPMVVAPKLETNN